MKFLDRDLSHLSYLRRVMDEGTRHSRGAQYCYTSQSYAFSGMAEFLAVRYPASLEENTAEQSGHLLSGIRDWCVDAAAIFKKTNKKLGVVRRLKDLGKDDQKWVHNYFSKNIRGMVQPITVGWARKADIHSGLYVLTITKRAGKTDVGYIEIPAKCGRFVRVGKNSFAVPVEEIIIRHLDEILGGVKIKESCAFRIIKSSEVFVQSDMSDDAYDMIAQTLGARQKSWVTAIEVDSTDKECISAIMGMVKTSEDTITLCMPMVRLEDLRSLPNDVFDEDERMEKFKPYVTFPTKCVFDTLKDGPRLLIHPYESYDASLVKFLKDAAKDTKVVSIRIALYRVSSDSDIIKALLAASEKGKMVTALIELKARFDERHNMDVSNVLRASNVNVVWTNADIKTHAKVCLVTRREKKGRLKIYSHIGTGNYSQSNSRSYVDYSYFTADQDLGEELVQFFSILTSSQDNFKSKRIVYAPYNLKSVLVNEIDRQIKLAKEGKSATIIAKCNAITDEGVAKRLVEAAEAGVSVRLIVRSACIIQPMKNLTIDSIVGRWLEHSRIYAFGTSNKHSSVYIGSSDLMTRNLSRRNELLIRVDEKPIKDRLLSHLSGYLTDNVNRRHILPGYGYELVKAKDKSQRFDVQDALRREAKSLSV